MSSIWQRLLSPWRRSAAQRRKRRRKGGHVTQATFWEGHWRRPDMDFAFLGRPVSPEIVAALEEGWLPAGGRALDAGCGEGVIAHWLSEQGFDALGVDIAPSAIDRARALHPEGASLRFLVADLYRSPLVDEEPFDVVIDRGCFHQMRRSNLRGYARNLLAMSAEDARMLIFHRAYRRGIPLGDPRERARIVERVAGAYEGLFEIERVADTFMDRDFGARPETRLGGVALWLVRAKR